MAESPARHNPTSIHNPSRSRLSALFQPFLTRFKAVISSPPASHCLFGDFPPDKTPLSFSVKTWTSLLQGYERSVASSAAISRVEYREASGSSPAGGNLLLEVTSPSTGAMVLVKIDRFQWTDDDEAGANIDLPFENRVTARPEAMKMGVNSDTGKIVGSLDFRQSNALPSVLWITYLLAAADIIHEQLETSGNDSIPTPRLLYRSLVSPSQFVQQTLQSQVERQTSGFIGEKQLSVREELLHNIHRYAGEGVEMLPKGAAWDDVDAAVPGLLVAAAIHYCKAKQQSS